VHCDPSDLRVCCPGDQLRRTGKRLTCEILHMVVPLMQHLSNREFVATVDHLLEDQSRPVAVRVGFARTCACGCGITVMAPRKFVNQEHYNAWLSRVRYFGRNRTPEDR